MNKIINANIHGYVFPIDELAYDQLKLYLEQLKQGIQEEEVYNDIENRIAELFNYKLKTGKPAIFESDVADIILQIGSVDELVGAEQEENPVGSNNQKSNENTQNAGDSIPNNTQATLPERRLFRDEDSKWILGVCAGIAAYLQWDVKWVRLGFVCLLPFTGGAIALIYIFLGVALQPARTLSEKLQMQGAPITFDNLGKVVEQAARTAMDKGKPVVEDISRRGVPLFVKLLAASGLIFLLIITVPALYTLFISAATIAWVWEVVSVHIFWSSTQSLYFVLALIAVTLIPLASIFYSLVRVLVDGKKIAWYYRLPFILIWWLSFSYLMVNSISLGREFSGEETVVERKSPDSTFNKRLKNIQISAWPDTSSQYGVTGDGWDSEGFWLEGNQVGLHMLENQQTENVEFSLERTVDTMPYVQVEYSARGSKEHRMANAKSIQYNYHWESNKLKLDNILRFGKSVGGKWRAQQVHVKIFVPVGYTIQLDETCKNGVLLEYQPGEYYNFPVGSTGYKKIFVSTEGNELVD